MARARVRSPTPQKKKTYHRKWRVDKNSCTGSAGSGPGDQGDPDSDQGDSPPSEKGDPFPKKKAGEKCGQDIAKSGHRNDEADRKFSKDAQKKDEIESLEEDAKKDLRVTKDCPESPASVFRPCGLHSAGEEDESDILKKEGKEKKKKQSGIGKHQDLEVSGIPSPVELGRSRGLRAPPGRIRYRCPRHMIRRPKLPK
jgi:hypothetical protein